jgi:hypothetical protein
MSKAILVTGATGRQGGGLIKTLLASPDASTLKIIALSRSPQSPTANKLKEKGVVVIEGDLNNVPAIFENLEITKQPLWGIFSVQVCACKDISEDNETNLQFRVPVSKLQQPLQKSSKAKHLLIMPWPKMYSSLCMPLLTVEELNLRGLRRQSLNSAVRTISSTI